MSTTTTRRRRAMVFLAVASGLVCGGAVPATAADSSNVQVEVAAAPPEVFMKFKDLTVVPANDFRTISVFVPAGSYAVTAKLTAINQSTIGQVFLTCTLSAGEDFDRSFAMVDARDGVPESMALSVAHAFPGTISRQIDLVCDSRSGETILHFVKITATRVNQVVIIPG